MAKFYTLGCYTAKGLGGFVSNPSTHGAFLYPMNESVDKSAPIRDSKYGKVEAVINDILRG